MSIATEITALNTNLTAAKNAVTAKGGTVGDTGLAGLATEIASIPSGGGGPVVPETLYGSVLVYPVVRKEFVAYEGTIYGCTVNDIDQDVFTAFTAQYPPAYGEVRFMGEEDYDDPSIFHWTYEYMDLLTGEAVPLDIGDLGTIGLDVTVDEGGGVAEISLYLEQTVNTDSYCWVDISDASEYSAIGNDGKDTYTIGGVGFTQDQIKGFALGSLNTTTPRFLSCANLEEVYFDYATSLTSIGDDFLKGCSQFNQEITIPSGVTSIGEYFLSGCSSFNQPLALPSSITSIGVGFLSVANSMVSTVNVGSLAASVIASSNDSFSASNGLAPACTTGITIAGTTASDWKAKFPDRSTYPYRKLIVAGQ